MLKVEINQGDPTRLPIRQIPCEIRRQGRRANTTARANERYELPEFQPGSGGITWKRFRRESFRQYISGQRLDEVVGDPNLDQIAVETDIILIANCDNIGARLANVSEDLHL